MKKAVSLILLLSLAVTASAVAAPQAVPESQASPLQRNGDPNMGDWQGTWQDGTPLCAQVIALGGGAYQANLLPAFDQRVPALYVLSGRNADGKVRFVEQARNSWIEDGVFTGRSLNKALQGFTLKKVERLSATLGAKPPQGAIVLFDGSNLDLWEKVIGNPYVLNLAQAIGGQNRVAYLRAQIFAPAAQETTLELGTDDGVKAWINGNPVHGNNVSRGVTPGQDKVRVKLDKGWNTLLVKVTQGSGDWGACVRLPEAKGLRVAANEAVLAKDAPESGAPLDATENYIMNWQVAGPFTQANKDGMGLFDIAFSPEQDGSGPWKPMPKPDLEDRTCPWLLLDSGVMEVRNGNIISKRLFKDHTVHVEFRTPFMPEAREQARGNSGVYLQGRYEVQVLDSYGLEGRDNECGGIYKQAAPRVNMCAPPLQWQTYDIVFRAPRFDASGKKTDDARITVRHNGVLIHENLALPESTVAGMGGDIREPGPLYLQDHGNPVQYRNIWVVEN